jgi:D-tyrosyl-tRNA(Tyr) deacylase
MKVVIQRVSQSSVTINNQLHNAIGKGLMILLGIEHEDEETDIEWLTNKISQLRIFADENGVMNLSINDVGGEVLLISQFTLHASTKKGNRPSYIQAARPEQAIPMYEKFIAKLQSNIQTPIKIGVFGADMQVSLINDGPVTIIIDSKNRV